jgi:hypothetical protein
MSSLSSRQVAMIRLRGQKGEIKKARELIKASAIRGESRRMLLSCRDAAETRQKLDRESVRMRCREKKGEVEGAKSSRMAREKGWVGEGMRE